MFLHFVALRLALLRLLRHQRTLLKGLLILRLCHVCIGVRSIRHLIGLRHESEIIVLLWIILSQVHLQLRLLLHHVSGPVIAVVGVVFVLNLRDRHSVECVVQTRVPSAKRATAPSHIMLVVAELDGVWVLSLVSPHNELGLILDVFEAVILSLIRSLLPRSLVSK